MKPQATRPASAPDKPKKTLPASIINAAPTAAKIMGCVKQIAELVPALDKELTQAKNEGAIALARAFVALHRLNARVGEELAPLSELFKRFKEQEIPALFETEGITNVPLAEGFRIGLSHRMFASIPVDQRDKAFQWLREHGLGDLITNTVNSGTLSAAAKSLLEDKNQELPKELFTVALVPNTSVTST